MRRVLVALISVMAVSCSHVKLGGSTSKHADTADSDGDGDDGEKTKGKDKDKDKDSDDTSANDDDKGETNEAHDKAAAGDDDTDDTDAPKAQPDKAKKKKKTKSSGKVASRADKTTEAYNQTLYVTEAADNEDMEAEDWIPKGHGKSWVLQTRLGKYVDVERLAIEGLAEVKREQAAGTWEDGMTYEVDGPDHSGMTSLEQDDVLDKIAGRQKHAHDKIAELKTQLAKAFRKEFPKASKAQLAKLDKMGLPIEITRGKKKGETCWRYNVDNFAFEEVTCWKKNGALASTKKTASEAAAEHTPGPKEQACRDRCQKGWLDCTRTASAVECGPAEATCDTDCEKKYDGK